MRMVLLAAVLALPVCGFANPIELPIVAEFPWAFSYSACPPPCGDADRDGSAELYTQADPFADSLTASEHTGGNTYVHTAIAPSWKPLCIGDADNDGLADLVAGSGSRWVYCIESPDSNSLPRDTLRVCRLVVLARDAAVTDLDQDGRNEIALSSGHDILLYETTGNNQYSLVASLRACDAVDGFSYGDADSDGRPDLVAPTTWGITFVFEGIADDLFDTVAVCTSGSGVELFQAAHADDMDGDSLREFVVMGWSSGSVWLYVFEAAGDNSFRIAWELTLPGTGWGGALGVGDIDADGRPDFVVCDGLNMRAYVSTADDQYEQVWTTSESGGCIVYDLNGTGPDELVHVQTLADRTVTVIREYGGQAVAERETGTVELARSPTVVRAAELVRFEGRILDALGREIRSATSDFGVCTSPLPPGVYFLKPEVQSPNAEPLTRKVVVTR